MFYNKEKSYSIKKEPMLSIGGQLEEEYLKSESNQVFMVQKINIFQKKQLQKVVSIHEINQKKIQNQNSTYFQEDQDQSSISKTSYSKPDILIKKSKGYLIKKPKEKKEKKEKLDKKDKYKTISLEEDFVPENFKFKEGFCVEDNVYDISMYSIKDKENFFQNEVNFEQEFQTLVQKVQNEKNDWLNERLEVAKQLSIQYAEEYNQRQEQKKQETQDPQEKKIQNKVTYQPKLIQATPFK